MEGEAEFVMGKCPDVVEELFVIGGGGMIGIDDEVGVGGADLGVADTEAFEAEFVVDDPTG